VVGLKQDPRRNLGTVLFDSKGRARRVRQTAFHALLFGFVLKSEQRRKQKIHWFGDFLMYFLHLVRNTHP